MRRVKRFAVMAVSAMLVSLVIPAGALAGGERHRLEFGSRPPMTDVKMKNVDGDSISISDVSGGRGTLVIFSCNACPWVKAWENRIAELGNTYSERGVGVIVINANDPDQVAEDRYEVMQERAQEKEFRFPYVVDSTSRVAAAFGATRTPEIFLFDGELRLVYHGAIDDNAKEPDKVESHYLREALEALLAGKPIEVRQTKALGCSIKFRNQA
ncbi:MAG: thioredoxin family protein [Acidobacteriota bacterium]